MALSAPTALTAAVSSGTDAAITSGSFTPAASSLIVVSLGSFTANGTGTLAWTISDTLGGLTWTKVEANNGGTGNATTATLWYAVAPSSPIAGTVTATPSYTGVASFGVYMQPFQITGGRTSGPVGATGTSASATVNLSAAPASTSEVILVGAAGQGSDPVTTQPTGFTALYTDQHAGTYTYVSTGYKNGSAAQSNAFGSLPNPAAVGIEVLGPAASTVTVNNPGPLSATVGTPFTQNITASTTSGTITGYSATGLPAGLSINASTGVISGTPTTVSTSSVTVTATDSNSNTGSTNFTITVSAANTVSIPTSGWQVLVAFSNNPLDDPALITTVASPGSAGTPGTPPTLGGVNVWTDVSQYVKHIHTGRGRQHELSRFEAGDCEIDLDNSSAAWNTWNTSGPFYGYLLPGKIVQIRYVHLGSTYYIFTGHLHSLPVMWPDQQQAEAQIKASDAFRLLALADITNTGYANGVLALTPNAYYRFGDQPGNITAKDSSGNARDGSYQAAFTLGYGGALPTEVDTAVDLKKTGYVQIPASAAMQTDTSSIAGWIKVHSVPTSTATVYLQNGTTGGGFTQAAATIYIAPDGAGGSYFQVALGGGIQATGYRTANGSVPTDGLWHHIAWTIGGTSGSGMLFYLDGVSLSLTSAGFSASATLVGTGIIALFGATTSSTSGYTPAFDGALDEWATYGSTLSAAQILAQYQSGVGQWANQSSGTRVGKILDTIGWSNGARVISTGASTVQAVTSSLTTTKSLMYLQLVELTEDGALFIDPQGRVVFYSRTDIQKNFNIAATFGDRSELTGGSEIPYQPGPDLALDDLDIWNEIPVSRVNGNTQTSTDSASVQQYGRRTLSGLTGLLNTTDQESAYRSQYDLDKYRQPMNRLRSVVVRPYAQVSCINAVAGLIDLTTRVVVNRNYMPGGGTTFTQTALVEHIEHDVDVESGDWVVAYALSPVDTRAYWVLGDSTYSVLGSTTRLAY